MAVKVIVGGTFAYLHKGHKALLRKAFSLGDYVYIGLTTDSYVSRNKGKSESYSRRKRALAEFARSHGKEFSIMPLKDRYGPSVSGDFNCIVVSSETYPIAKRINSIRRERGLKPLRIVKVAYVKAYDGKPIASHRIAAREIDRNGKSTSKGS